MAGLGLFVAVSVAQPHQEAEAKGAPPQTFQSSCPQDLRKDTHVAREVMPTRTEKRTTVAVATASNCLHPQLRAVRKKRPNPNSAN
ncbi:hypothetical protein BM1_08027 [Bipolaris maydis]|nr:hypothetical protein BM1_08027 [Bipolaris maydis]